jgi:hypothetical protein
MFYIGAMGLFLGAAQSRRLNLGLFLFFSVFAAAWISLLSAVAGYGFLLSIREGVIGAWSSETGVLSGLLLNRLVLHRNG